MLKINNGKKVDFDNMSMEEAMKILWDDYDKAMNLTYGKLLDPENVVEMESDTYDIFMTINGAYSDMKSISMLFAKKYDEAIQTQHKQALLLESILNRISEK